MQSMSMPAETWSYHAAASFLGMWVAMTAAMMPPSVAPVLWRYRQAVAGAGGARAGWLTGVVGAGYLSVWAGVGIAVYALGSVLGALATRSPMLARAIPILVGIVVLIAGALQFTRWKSRHLTGCREVPGHERSPVNVLAGWRSGVRLGVHCGQSSGGLMAICLGLGIMDLGVMAAVTVAITAERLAPRGEQVARGVGIVVVAAGVLLIARAARVLFAA
jgi:predicted metal-binding membrane protein